MIENTEELLFMQRIKEEAKIDNWDRITEYLISGLAENRNYEGLLTPQVFYKYFYVSDPDKGRYKILHDKLKKLFESTNKNTLILTAHGGSGKSIFAHLISQLISTEDTLKEFNDTKIIEIDFETKWSSWWVKLIDSLRNFLAKDLKERPIKSNNALKNLYLKCIDRIYNQGIIPSSSDAKFFANFNSILKKIKDSINSNYDICNNIHKIFSVDVLGELSSIKDREESSISAVILSFILYLICKDTQSITQESDYKNFLKSIPSLNNKYLIIFDNLEVFDNGSLHQIASVINKTNKIMHDMLFKLDNNNNLFQYFYKNYTFVCAMRTSTFNLLGGALNGGSNTLGHFYEHLELEYNDIFQEAILKKIRFLYYLGLQGSPFVKKLESVTKFLYNKSTRDSLKNTNNFFSEPKIDYALKIYIENNFVAFFNNDIRRATNSIINAFKQNVYSKQINALLNSPKEDINGVRMAIFRGLFDEIGESTFAKFGFEPIDPQNGGEKCSATRILLSYLKWDELHANVHLSLRKVLEHIRELGVYNAEQVAHWIYNISNVVASTNNDTTADKVKDYDHYNLISQRWASLITFSENLTKEELIHGIKQYFVMPNIPITINDYNINNIIVYLTPAGRCAIDNVTSQYEFFAYRINPQYTPLYCYDDIKTARGTLFSNLENVYQAINHYISGMIKRCPCQKNDEGYIGECSYNEITKSENEILQCGYFIRLQEILNILKTTIDYLDRYRLYIKKKKKIASESDFNRFEKQILLNIKNYSDIYWEIQSKTGRFKSCSIIDNLHVDTQDKKLHNVFKTLRTKGDKQAVQSLYYFAFKTKDEKRIDLLRIALNLLLKRVGEDCCDSNALTLYNELFIDSNSDNLSLYKLCQRIKTSESFVLK